MKSCAVGRSDDASASQRSTRGEEVSLWMKTIPAAALRALGTGTGLLLVGGAMSFIARTI